jgi:hypothetical protein
MRVLIFGSRTWDDIEATFRVLRKLTWLSEAVNSPLVLVEGCCPEGADLHAETWVEALNLGTGGEPRVSIEHHPPVTPTALALKQRNVEMADSKPDFAIGFFRGETPGSMHMLDQLDLRGVPVYRVNWEER